MMFCTITCLMAFLSFNKNNMQVKGEITRPSIEVLPREIHTFDDEESIVSFTVRCNSSEFTIQTVDIEIVDTSVVEILKVDKNFLETNKTDEEISFNFGMKIIGRRIGRTATVFNFTLHMNTSWDYIASNSIIVTRRQNIFDNILTYLLVFLVVANNFGIGCNFEYTVGKELVKNPRTIAMGVVCQFLLLPLLSFVLSWLLVSNRALAFGVLTVGCMPGGGLASLWCGILDGNILISLCLTLLTNILALVTIPLWLDTLGSIYLDSRTMIPFIDVAVFSLIPIIPIIFGIGIRKCTEMRSRNKVIDFAVRSVRPFSTVLHIFCMTYTAIVGFYLLRDFVKIWKASFLSVSLPWIGAVLSFTIAYFFRLPIAKVKTIAVEVLSVNSALAVVILKNTLPQPEADISSVAPLLSFIFTQLPLFFIGLLTILDGMWKSRTDASKANQCSEDTEVDLRESYEEEEPEDEQYELQGLRNEVSV